MGWTGQPDENLVASSSAADAHEPSGKHAAGNVPAQVLLDEARQAKAVLAALPCLREEGLEVLSNHAMQRHALG